MGMWGRGRGKGQHLSYPENKLLIFLSAYFVCSEVGLKYCVKSILHLSHLLIMNEC